MDERKKYALLLAATILAARKLASLSDTTGSGPAKLCAAESAVDQARGQNLARVVFRLIFPSERF